MATKMTAKPIKPAQQKRARARERHRTQLAVGAHLIGAALALALAAAGLMPLANGVLLAGLLMLAAQTAALTRAIVALEPTTSGMLASEADRLARAERRCDRLHIISEMTKAKASGDWQARHHLDALLAEAMDDAQTGADGPANG